FTTIESGIITVETTSALGSTTGGTRVLDPGTLNLAVTGTSEALFLNGDGPGSGALAMNFAAESYAYNGDITIESNTEIFVGGKLTLKGNLTGSNATLSKTGSGELVYEFASGKASTFTGKTAVDGGTLSLHNPNQNDIAGDLDINKGTVRLHGT